MPIRVTICVPDQRKVHSSSTLGTCSNECFATFERFVLSGNSSTHSELHALTGITFSRLLHFRLALAYKS